MTHSEPVIRTFNYRGRSRTTESRQKPCCRFLQVSVNKGDGHRALARCSGNALDRAVAHIPGREGAGDRGLQVVGCAPQRPGAWSLAVGQEVGTSDEITAGI